MPITVSDTAFSADELDRFAAFFEEHGYGVLRGLYDEADLRACEEELAEVHRRVADAPVGSDLASYAGSLAFPEPVDVFIDGERYIHKVNRISDLAPIADAAFRHPALVELSGRLLGPEATLHDAALMYQDARGDTESHYTRLHWHTDGDALPVDFRFLLPTVTYAVHLDATGPANGFLRVLPGSHRMPSPDGLTFETLDDEVLVFVERGDVLAHHSGLWHSAARGSGDGGLGARRHFRGAWTARRPPEVEDIVGMQDDFPIDAPWEVTEAAAAR